MRFERISWNIPIAIAEDNTHEKHVAVGSDKSHQHGYYHIYQVEQRENIVREDPADAL